MLVLQRPHNVTEYFISNDGFSSLGEEYFLIDSSTGEIYLRKSVLNDNFNTERYTVSTSSTLYRAVHCR